MLCFVFAALVVLLDQFFKRWVVRSIDLFGGMDLIPGVIELTHIHNTGAAFGIFAGQRWLLAAVAFIACLVLIFILLRYTEGFWGTLGLSAVLGGAVGNLVDRVLYGYVIDMFRTLFIDFAIFNIADIFITLGFITFCIHFISASVKTAKEEKRAFEDARVDLDDEEYDEYYDENGEPYENDSPYEHAGQDIPDFDEFPEEGDAPPPIDFDSEPDFEDLKEYMPASIQSEPAVISPPPIPDKIDPNSWHEYYDKPVEHGTETLDALRALELELDSIEDYDVDAMLREYGFEDDGGKRDDL